MIGFVEMGRDRRLYRLLQDTRHGRVTLCETEQTDKIVEAVTNYIAQRLIEREQALAADTRAVQRDEGRQLPAHEPAAPIPERRQRRLLVRLFVFIVDLLGMAVLFGLIAAAAWYVYRLQAAG